MTRLMSHLPVDHAVFRIFPHPFVSIVVAVSWLMLQHSVSVGNLVMAGVCGLIIPHLTQNFIIRTPNVHWGEVIRLIGMVLADIVTSNIRVAGLILRSPERLQPCWYRVPLDTNHPQVNSLLAMIITTTPGTVSAGIDDERGDILVHSLHCLDPEADIADIKRRYEQTLIRIYDAPLAEHWLSHDELPPPDTPIEELDAKTENRSS